MQRQLFSPGADFQPIVARVLRRPELIEALLEGLGSETARVKYGSSRVLRLVSERAPEVLYPRFDFFVGLLDCDSTFLRWDAARIVANLAAADREDKFEKVFEKYFAPVSGRQMIGAANTIRWAAKIALAKPHLADRIVHEILKVRRANYQTEECRNVAIGHAIQSLGQFFAHIKNKRKVREFVESQLANPRNATRGKAERFLKQRRPVRAATAL